MAAALHPGIDDRQVIDSDRFVIDLSSQRVFPLSEYPDYAPKKRGRKQHVATGYRLASKGSRAKDGMYVPLPTIQFGGVRYTSVEAMQWFGERLGRRAGEPTPTQSACRQRAIEHAARELNHIGI